MALNTQNVNLKMTAGFASQFPTDPIPQVALSGRSNVGKSSLINTLLGRKSLARVSATPGKTITVNFYEVDENGNPKVDAQGNVILSPVQFYPNVVYESTSGLAFYNSHVVSEVTLTRGWTAPSKASVKGNGHSGKKVVPSNVQYTAPKRPYSISTLVPQQPKAEVTVSKNKQVTPEQTRTGMEKLMKKLQPASLK